MSRNQSMPLKVGYVLKRFPRLSETFVLNEILELERQGVEIEIFSLLRPPEELQHALLSQLKAQVTYLPSGSAAELLQVRQATPSGKLAKGSVAELIEPEGLPFDPAMPGKNGRDTVALILKASCVTLLARARGVQHLHAHFGSDATTVAMLAGRLACLSYSFTAHARDIYHTYIDARSDALMRRAKIAEAAFVATVSDFNRRHLIGLAGPASAAKIHRLYNGIDLSRCNFTASGRAGNLVLAVGRLVEKKGFNDLVEACRIAQALGATFRCMIVGDGPLQGQLSEQVSACGLDNVVELSGPRRQEELFAIMRTATMLALPCIVTDSGDRDGLPTVLLEALACGLPSISTTVSGVPEIIEHGRTGLLVEPGQPQSLAEAIMKLLASPHEANQFAAAGREKAEMDFDLNTNVATLHAHFEHCANAASPTDSGEIDEHRLRVG